MGSGKTPKNRAHCLAPKINPMRDRSRIFLHRSFSIIRRGIHSLSTAFVEKRENSIPSGRCMCNKRKNAAYCSCLLHPICNRVMVYCIRYQPASRPAPSFEDQQRGAWLPPLAHVCREIRVSEFLSRLWSRTPCHFRLSCTGEGSRLCIM